MGGEADHVDEMPVERGAFLGHCNAFSNSQYGLPANAFVG